MGKPEEILEIESHDVSDWKGLCDRYEEIRSLPNTFVFRGQRSACWNLETRLERAALDRFGIDPRYVRDAEEKLLKQFKRQARHYLNRVPSDKVPEIEKLEWYSIMQHFGAPTRLLDWSFSFFVATFFAVENIKKDQTCSIWALDLSELKRRALDESEVQHNRNFEELEIDRKKLAKRVFKGQPKTGVFPVQPFILNERLVIQKGIFIAPGDVSVPFIENLKSTFSETKSRRESIIKINYTCNGDNVSDTIERLHNMNIDRGALFPDLEGYASSLENYFAMPKAIGGLKELIEE